MLLLQYSVILQGPAGCSQALAGVNCVAGPQQPPPRLQAHVGVPSRHASSRHLCVPTPRLRRRMQIPSRHSLANAAAPKQQKLAVKRTRTLEAARHIAYDPLRFLACLTFLPCPAGSNLPSHPLGQLWYALPCLA